MFATCRNQGCIPSQRDAELVPHLLVCPVLTVPLSATLTSFLE